MERNQLLAALRKMQVETGSLVCLGCGHEHNCGVHGCAIIREAVEQLEEQHLDASWIHQLRKPAGGGVWMTREEAIERATRDLMSAGINLQTATYLGAPAQYIETIKRKTEYLERVALLISRYWVEVEEVRT